MEAVRVYYSGVRGSGCDGTIGRYWGTGYNAVALSAESLVEVLDGGVSSSHKCGNFSKAPASTILLRIAIPVA